LQNKASQLGVDVSEVVNYLLLQLLDNAVQPTTANKVSAAPVIHQASEPTSPQESEYIDPTIARLAGLIDTF
jgi:hypothetical protein